MDHGLLSAPRFQVHRVFLRQINHRLDIKKGKLRCCDRNHRTQRLILIVLKICPVSHSKVLVPVFFCVIFKQDFWKFIITLWCLILIRGNTFHDYPSKTKSLTFPNSSNWIKPVCSISFTSWVAFSISTPKIATRWHIAIWRDDCSNFCMITSKTQERGRQSNVYPWKFIKTKILPKNFGQDF